MKRYALYDLYETETEPGELICTSDDYAEIRAAARERTKETDGECTLYIIVYCRKSKNMKFRKNPQAKYKTCIYCGTEWNVSVKDKYDRYICPVCRRKDKHRN